MLAVMEGLACCPARLASHPDWVGQNHTYMLCTYGNVGRSFTKCTFMYGVCTWFWPALHPDQYKVHRSSRESKAREVLEWH